MRTTSILVFGAIAACSSDPAPRAPGGLDAAVSDAAADELRLHDAAMLQDAFVAPYVPRSRTRAAPACADPDLAPLRDGTSIDGFVCTRVGASTEVGTGDWPDVSGLPAPLRYVRPGAPAGGDGSRDRPFATLDAALASSPAAIVLSAGEHPAPATLALAADLVIAGFGSTATSIVSSASGSVISVRRATHVTLRGLALRATAAMPDSESAVIDAPDAEMVLRDVRITGGSHGLRVAHGTLDARGLTVRDARANGVWLAGDARATITDFLVRGSGQQGIRAESAHVVLSRGFVRASARHGIVLLGATSASGGVAACFDGSTAAGPRDCVDHVASMDNGVAALFAQDDRSVDARLLTLAATRLGTVTGGMAGDGLVAVNGCTLTLDADITVIERQGMGSAVIANARAGVLGQGARTTLTVRGALVTANAGGAVLVTDSATAPMVGECLLEANAFGGVVVTPGASAGIVQCNGIAETRTGTLATLNGDITMADGVHLNGARGETQLAHNMISASERFGLLVNGGVGTLFSNTGAENLYGIGVYGGAIVAGDLESIRGRSTMLPASPALAGGL